MNHVPRARRARPPLDQAGLNELALRTAADIKGARVTVMKEIGPAVFDSALAGIAAAIREFYVFPEKRAGIAARTASARARSSAEGSRSDISSSLCTSVIVRPLAPLTAPPRSASQNPRIWARTRFTSVVTSCPSSSATIVAMSSADDRTALCGEQFPGNENLSCLKPKGHAGGHATCLGYHPEPYDVYAIELSSFSLSVGTADYVTLLTRPFNWIEKVQIAAAAGFEVTRLELVPGRPNLVLSAWKGRWKYDGPPA
mgnify:CR=1 FL=1